MNVINSIHSLEIMQHVVSQHSTGLYQPSPSIKCKLSTKPWKRQRKKQEYKKKWQSNLSHLKWFHLHYLFVLSNFCQVQARNQ